MPYQTVNFADVEDFDALPEGNYAVEIDKVEVRRNKADDGDYLNWELVVLDGDYENRRLWMITSLKPTALFRLKATFDQLDVLDGDEMELEYDDDQEVTNSSGPNLLYPDVVGLEATANVTNEMYDGKERNRVNELSTGKKSKAKKRGRVESDNGQVRKARSSRAKSRDDDDQYDIDYDDEEEEEETPRRSAARSSTTARRDSRRSSGRRRLR